MRKFLGGRGSFIALGLAATLGALAVARAASPAASSVAVPSLAEYIKAICTAGFRSAPPQEAPFLAENDAAMTQMMVGMDIKPSGDVDGDFAAMMIPHHQGAIDMAQAELRYGHNEQLRRIAQEIIVEQQQEIAAMRLALGQPLPPSVAAPDQPSRPTRRPARDAPQWLHAANEHEGSHTMTRDLSHPPCWLALCLPPPHPALGRPGTRGGVRARHSDQPPRPRLCG